MYTRGGQVEARRPGLDALVRRLSARHDVDCSHKHWVRTHPDSSSGSSRRSATASRWSRERTTAKFTISGFIFLSTYHRWYRSRGIRPCKDVVLQAGRTLAQRFNEDGQYLRSFVAEDSLFIDIMMNVGHHLLRCARNQRQKTARHRGPALHHDPAVSGARRRLNRARRHLRSRDRRVSPADHAAGLSRRFLLVARPGLGAVWFLDGLRIQPRSAVPANGGSLRGLLHHPHARRRRPAVGLQRSRSKIARWLIPPPRPLPQPGCCACAARFLIR